MIKINLNGVSTFIFLMLSTSLKRLSKKDKTITIEKVYDQDNYILDEPMNSIGNAPVSLEMCFGKYTSPEIFSYTLKNPIVFSKMGIVYHNRRFLIDNIRSEYSYESEWFFKKLKKNFLFQYKKFLKSDPIPFRFLYRFFSKTNFVSGTTLLLVSKNSRGYCHWILEELPKLKLLYEKKMKSINLLVDQNIPEWKRESLEVLGFIDNIIQMNSSKMRFENLIVIDNLSDVNNTLHNKPIYWLNNFFLNYRTKEEYNYKKIYISRQKANYRKILNSSEVEEVVIKNGFQIVYLEDYSIEEKINMFKGAKIILAPHGAGLTHLVMSKNVKVIEILPEKLHFTHHYYVLSCILGHNYNFMTAPLISTGNDYGRGDYFVNIESLKKLIKIS